MRRFQLLFIGLIPLLFFISCDSNSDEYDGFETIELEKNEVPPSPKTDLSYKISHFEDTATVIFKVQPIYSFEVSDNAGYIETRQYHSAQAKKSALISDRGDIVEFIFYAASGVKDPEYDYDLGGGVTGTFFSTELQMQLDFLEIPTWDWQQMPDSFWVPKEFMNVNKVAAFVSKDYGLIRLSYDEDYKIEILQ